MKILEAFGEPVSYGGEESFLLTVLENMDRTGLEADILTPYYCDSKRAADVISTYGGQVYSLGYAFRPGKSRYESAAGIRRFLSEHRYDLIHIHSGSNSMLSQYARLAHAAGIPRIIVHSHCTGKKGIVHTASKLITAYSLTKYPTDYIACSVEAGEWRFPQNICRSRLRIINNGIDTDSFKFDEVTRCRVREQYGIKDETVLIGNVGRLTYQKNQEFLLNIMEKLCSYGSGDYKLMLVGDGEDYDHLNHIADCLGVAENVIFTGRTDKAHEMYQAMDVLAVPSKYEGLAITVIEAQAAGLEVVTSESVPESAALTDSFKRILLSDTEGWISALAEEHQRHSEYNDIVGKSEFSAAVTSELIRKLYTSR